MATDRVNLFPSRANLVLMKQRTQAAIRGWNLLKRKRDALEMKLREMVAQLTKVSAVVDNAIKEAIFSLAKANFLDTDLKPAYVAGPDRADVFLRIRSNRVVGTLLPTFHLVMREPSSFPLTGLAHGGVQVDVVRKKFQEAVKLLVELASLQFSVKVLKEAVRTTNQRINGLEYVLIPRFQRTIEYIRDELDEYEREDFYRLKRSQAKQKKAKEQFSRIATEKTMGKVMDDSDEKNLNAYRRRRLRTTRESFT